MLQSCGLYAFIYRRGHVMTASQVTRLRSVCVCNLKRRHQRNPQTPTAARHCQDDDRPAGLSSPVASLKRKSATISSRQSIPRAILLRYYVYIHRPSYFRLLLPTASFIYINKYYYVLRTRAVVRARNIVYINELLCSRIYRKMYRKRQSLVV